MDDDGGVGRVIVDYLGHVLIMVIATEWVAVVGGTFFPVYLWDSIFGAMVAFVG